MTRGRGGVEAEQLPAMTERGRLTSISMEIRIFANNELLLAIKSIKCAYTNIFDYFCYNEEY